MTLDTAFDLIPFLASLGLCIGVAIYAWQRSKVIGARLYALTTIGQVIWLVGYIFELISLRLEAKLFWDHAQWIGVIIASVVWFPFVLDYIGREMAHRARLLAGLLVPPLIGWGVLVAGTLAGRFRADARLLPSPPFGELTYSFTTVDLVLTLYVYVFMLMGIGLLVNHLRHVRAIYRLQTGIILTGYLIPIIGGFAAFTDLRLVGQRDLAPLTFGVSNLLIAWGLFRYGLFDLVPIAREAVIESVSDSILVLDPQNRVVDINRAALANVGRTASEVIGQPVARLYPERGDILQRFENVAEAHTELVLQAPDGEARTIDLRISPVLDKRSEIIGRVIVSRDITALKQAQAAEQEQRMVAETLMKIALALNSTLDLNEVLEGILVNTQRIVGYGWGEVVSIHRGLVRIEHTADYPSTGTAAGMWPMQHSLPIKRMAATERGCLIVDTLASSDWTAIDGMGWIRSFLGMPILIDEEIIGFINLASDQPNAFTDVHAQRLEAVSGQAAIAIRNAKAYQQAQSLGVLAERQRLARELHDSVSQTVFAATTMAELLPHVRHDAEKLDRYIGEVALLTRSAMAEMRTLMIELQPDAITGTEFTALLRTLCDALSGSARIPVELTTSGRIFLEPKTQTVFYRIAQEAASNIQRHARASKVSLHFEQTGHQSELRISDNGCGFDPLAAASAGRGILLMRDQAARIGAALEIRSQPNAGTDIVLRGA